MPDNTKIRSFILVCTLPGLSASGSESVSVSILPMTQSEGYSPAVYPLDGGTVNMQLLMPESHGCPFDSDTDSDPDPGSSDSTQIPADETSHAISGSTILPFLVHSLSCNYSRILEHENSSNKVTMA
jgi:hypothetical protein